MREELAPTAFCVLLATIMLGAFVYVDYRDRNRPRCGARSPVQPFHYCSREPQHDGDHAEARMGLDFQWGPDE